MDPNDEINALTAGIDALARSPIGELLNDEDVRRARSARSEYEELIQWPSEIAENLAPLGWIAFGTAPAEEYREAARLAGAGESEAAEELLTKTWNGDDRLRWAVTRISSIYSGHESMRSIGHQRRKQLDEALENHNEERYASAIGLVLPQIDGIVHDLTGKAAKSFFASGPKAKHLHDEETMAGHPNGLSVLARLFNKDRRTTTVEGELRRNGILHGRELGYDTLRNSTKAFVALLSVIEWAQPLAAAKAEQLARDEEERYAGHEGRDDFGRRLDRRGFEAAQSALTKLAHYQFGHFKRRGKYEASIEDLDKPEGLPAIKGLMLETSANRQSYRAWMSTETFVVFGIAGANGEFEGWKYVGEERPPTDVSGSDAWRHDIEDMPHDDW